MNKGLKDALERGLQAGFEDAAKAQEAAQQKQEQLAACHVAAADLIEGLNTLRDMPNSTFDYSINLQSNRFWINTNISVASQVKGTGNLGICVEYQNDHVGFTAFGNDHRSTGTETVRAEEGNTAPLLEFVARKAAANGMIPAQTSQPQRMPGL
jgi:hypothetical protein